LADIRKTDALHTVGGETARHGKESRQKCPRPPLKRLNARSSFEGVRARVGSDSEPAQFARKTQKNKKGDAPW
jgi:hypothetical protein